MKSYAVALTIIIVGITISAAPNEICLGDAIRSLYNNRDYIHKLFKDCKPLIWNVKIVVPCEGSSKPNFYDFEDSSWTYWSSNSKQIIGTFLNLAGSYQRLDGKLGHLIDDDRLIEIVISILSDTTSIHGYCAQDASNFLKWEVYYPFMQKHGELLRAAIVRADLSNDEKLRFLLISNPPDSVKKKIQIDNKNLRLSFRIRLGDIKAEDSIIALYEQTKGYSHKADIAKEMIYSGSRKCIAHLIKKFNDSVFKSVTISKWTIPVESIRFPIINELQKWHPENCVLNQKPDFFSYPIPRYADTVKVAAFSEAFKAWAKQTYGVVPEKKDPTPNILDNSSCYY